MEKENIQNLIEEAANKFGRINLSSGNCGKFALALGEKLKELGFEPTLGILFKHMEGAKFNNIDDLAGTDPVIYHVVLSLDDKIYDGTGETNIDKLLEISIEEYKDKRPVFLSGVGIEEEALKTIIDFDTNWHINEHEFYNSFKNINKEISFKKDGSKRNRP